MGKNISVDNLFDAWMSSLVSQGIVKIPIRGEKAQVKFKQIFDIIGEHPDIETEDMEKFDDTLLNFFTYFDHDSFGNYLKLENKFKDIEEMSGLVHVCSETPEIELRYMGENAGIYLDKLPEKYKSLIQDIIKVMIF